MIPFLRSLTWRGWSLLAAVLLAVVAVVIATRPTDRAVTQARDAGAVEAVATGQAIILEQIERANNAETEVRRSDDAARRERCLRNATPETRSHCDRFRSVPDRPAPGG